MLASHMNGFWSSCLMMGLEKHWEMAPATCVGGPDEAPGFWLQPGPVLAMAIIWGVERR